MFSMVLDGSGSVSFDTDPDSGSSHFFYTDPDTGKLYGFHGSGSGTATLSTVQQTNIL